MTTEHEKLKQLDHTYLWHPFTQMQEWMGEEPVIISRGDGHYLIDVQGKKYLDGVSSLWCNVHGHRKKGDRRCDQGSARSHRPLDVSRFKPRARHSARGKIDRHCSAWIKARVLLRQRRRGRRDCAQDGCAVLATQRRDRANFDRFACGVISRRHRGLDEHGLLGNFPSLSQEPAVPRAAPHSAARVSLLPVYERWGRARSGAQRRGAETFRK